MRPFALNDFSHSLKAVILTIILIIGNNSEGAGRIHLNIQFTQGPSQISVIAQSNIPQANFRVPGKSFEVGKEAKKKKFERDKHLALYLVY